ncbi:MAG: hypothetical protein OXT70_01130 [Chloroflexota bacterium]|nr:hypothetical protein [Chloroflexota bacterium]
MAEPRLGTRREVRTQNGRWLLQERCVLVAERNYWKNVAWRRHTGERWNWIEPHTRKSNLPLP